MNKIRKNIQQHTYNYDDSDADNTNVVFYEVLNYLYLMNFYKWETGFAFATVALHDISYSNRNFIIACIFEKQPVS